MVGWLVGCLADFLLSPCRWSLHLLHSHPPPFLPEETEQRSEDADLPEGSQGGLLAQREEDEEAELPGLHGSLQVCGSVLVVLEGGFWFLTAFCLNLLLFFFSLITFLL